MTDLARSEIFARVRHASRGHGRNTASDNGTNYAITGAHAVGPIVGGTNPITELSPWANFEF